MLKIGNKVPHNVFVGRTELSKIYKGDTLIFNNKSIELTSFAGKFDVTVSGFVNPVWEYNGEIQNGNTGKFTILNDNDVVILSWDGLESNTQFVVNLDGRSSFSAGLEDLRKKITYQLSLSACTEITGDLRDLGGKITSSVGLSGCSQITGDLKDLGGKITFWLNLSNCTKITGNLEDLGGKITNTLDLSDCPKVKGIYVPVNSSSVPSTINLSRTGLTASDIDSTLNNISITTKKNGKFTAGGMKRTSASDSAVEKLVSQGWTISGITKTEAYLND